MKPRLGFTLIELLVALVLVALTSTIAAVAFRAAPATRQGWRSALLDARHRAIASGTPVTGYIDSVGLFTARSDGTIVSDSTPTLRFGFNAPPR